MDGLTGYGALMGAQGRMPANGDTLRPGGDDKMIVMFSRKAIQNEARSTAEGRPVYDPVDYVRVQQPGERDFVERPVRFDDQHRWPRQWDAFQRQQQQVPDGTPLDVLFPAQPEIVAMLRHVNILTVEHLAGAEGNALSNIGSGGATWKAHAAKFMAAANSAAPMHKMESELRERDAQIAKQATELDALRGQVERLMARFSEDDQPRRRRNQE